MSERALLLVAVTASVVNAVASLVRTVWSYEKRRAWRRRSDV